MKKILGIIIVSAFILSLMGSVSPIIQSSMKNFTGRKYYSSSSLPLPNPIDKNYAEQSK